MSLKCRCGSEDKIRFVDGNMIRELDHKPHICLDGFLKSRQEQIRQKCIVNQDTHSIFDQKRLGEIDECLERLCMIEEIVTEKLTVDGMTPNPAKVGMYMKFIYDKILLS